MKSENNSQPIDICERSFEFAVRLVKMCQSLHKDPEIRNVDGCKYQGITGQPKQS